MNRRAFGWSSLSRILAAATLAAAALCIGLALAPHQLETALPAATASPSAATSPVATATPASTGSNIEQAGTGLIEIPSLNFVAKLDTMPAPTAGEILDPPTTTEAFVITGLGWGTPRTPNNGSTLIALHSSRTASEPAIGDALLDRSTGTLLLSPTDRIRVDGVLYAVVETVIVEKGGALIEQADIWDSSWDLILVTCQQYADGSPSDLGVILAQRLPAD